jgi:hypothetical protein
MLWQGSGKDEPRSYGRLVLLRMRRNARINSGRWSRSSEKLKRTTRSRAVRPARVTSKQDHASIIGRTAARQ